jgi:hypothetical protein
MSNSALAKSPTRDLDRPSTAKTQWLDIDRIKSDANNPQTFFNLLPRLKFRAIGAGYASQYSGIRLKYKQGKWILQNFNGKFGGAQGDAWNIVKVLHNLDPKDKEDLKRLCKILTQASGGQISKTDRRENTAHQIQYVAPKKVKFVPNQGQLLKLSSIPKYADYNSEIGAATLAYFNRWQVGKAILQKYNIRPLFSVKYANGGFTQKFDRKDFAYAWTVGGVAQTAKYKRPNAPKGEKERPLQWSGNYVFGWKQLPRDLTEITVIIAAREKDTLVLNQHFNHLGIYVICFGSETVKMGVKFIQDLRNRPIKIKEQRSL